MFINSIISHLALGIYCLLPTQIPAQGGNGSAAVDYPFDRGEVLEYSMHYGWFHIGRATVQIEDDIQYRSGQSCYEMRVNGGTAGLLNIFASVDDEWGAVIKEDDLTPVFTYRNIQEGKYELEERVHIVPDSGQIRVDRRRLDKDKSSVNHYEYDPEQAMYDMLSGILVMRTTDFSQYVEGDTITLDTFFEDTFYHFKILYQGIEMVKTGVGKLRAHKLIPVMPDNKVFDGENSVTAWFSADRNRLPLKMTADMFIGRASCEITSYKNIKYGPDYRPN